MEQEILYCGNYFHYGSQVFFETKYVSNEKEICKYLVEECSSRVELKNKTKQKVLSRCKLTICEEQKRIPIEYNER